MNNLGIYWDLAGPVGWAEPGRGDLPVDKCLTSAQILQGGGYENIESDLLGQKLDHKKRQNSNRPFREHPQRSNVETCDLQDIRSE